jgi:hypothetical protein
MLQYLRYDFYKIMLRIIIYSLSVSSAMKNSGCPPGKNSYFFDALCIFLLNKLRCNFLPCFIKGTCRGCLNSICGIHQLHQTANQADR